MFAPPACETKVALRTTEQQQQVPRQHCLAEYYRARMPAEQQQLAVLAVAEEAPSVSVSPEVRAAFAAMAKEVVCEQQEVMGCDDALRMARETTRLVLGLLAVMLRHAVFGLSTTVHHWHLRHCLADCFQMHHFRCSIPTSVR